MDCLDYSKTTDFGSLYSNLGSIKLYGTGINVVMDDEQGGNTILDLGKKKKKHTNKYCNMDQYMMGVTHLMKSLAVSM